MRLDVTIERERLRVWAYDSNFAERKTNEKSAAEGGVAAAEDGERVREDEDDIFLRDLLGEK
jgi:predicted transcriptional regulator